jgi:hypothetical protein
VHFPVRTMAGHEKPREELANMATELVRFAVECRRRAASWTEHALRWERSRDASLRGAGPHATAVAGHAEQLAAELRLAAKALLEIVSPSS